MLVDHENSQVARFRARLVVVLLTATVLPAAVTVLYLVPPGPGTFYPGCTFNVLTGLHCPGCGATRASHALLHGDLAQALAFNCAYVLALPFLLWGACAYIHGLWTGERLTARRIHPWVMRLLFGGLAAFWILRNIDAHPFNLLAPHVLPEHGP